MPNPKVAAAKDKLIANLRKEGISLAALSQFMPIQYTKVREGVLENDPEALIKDRIKIRLMNMFLHPIRKNYSNNNKKAEGSSPSEFAFCFYVYQKRCFPIHSFRYFFITG